MWFGFQGIRTVIALHAQVSVPQTVVVQEIGGEAVLVDLHGGFYYGLNGTATEMWRMLVERQTPAAALERLKQTQSAPVEVLERDLLRLTEDLLRRKLLTLIAD